jgi:hypothetical protein
MSEVDSAVVELSIEGLWISAKGFSQKHRAASTERDDEQTPKCNGEYDRECSIMDGQIDMGMAADRQSDDAPSKIVNHH